MSAEPKKSYLFDRSSPVNCDQRIGSFIVPRDVNIAPMKLVSRIVALLDAAGVSNKYLPAECTISRCKIPQPAFIQYNPISFDSAASFRATCCASNKRRFVGNVDDKRCVRILNRLLSFRRCRTSTRAVLGLRRRQGIVVRNWQLVDTSCFTVNPIPFEFAIPFPHPRRLFQRHAADYAPITQPIHSATNVRVRPSMRTVISARLS